MKGWSVFTTVGEEREEFRHFKEAAGPWVEMVLAPFLDCVFIHMRVFVRGEKDFTYTHDKTTTAPLPQPHSSSTQNEPPTPQTHPPESQSENSAAH